MNFKVTNQQKPEMNYNDQMSRNMTNQPSVNDYLAQMSNNQTQRSKELHVDLEPAALKQGQLTIFNFYLIKTFRIKLLLQKIIY